MFQRFECDLFYIEFYIKEIRVYRKEIHGCKNTDISLVLLAVPLRNHKEGVKERRNC